MPVKARAFLRFLLFPLGLILLIVVAFLLQEGTILTPVHQVPATQDRLAKPSLPAQPSQPDYGAQDFWLYCLPCHGDRGQGLTDEFRQTYPPEDRNCWNSGCHGTRPYRNGWTLPPTVPAVIGVGALNNFSNAAALHTFISKLMPFQAPGSLDEPTYWRLTAFLLRQNGYWNGLGEIDASNAEQIPINSVNAVPLNQASGVREGSNGTRVLAFVGGGLVVIMILVWFLQKKVDS